jgi:hypothetical protein
MEIYSNPSAALTEISEPPPIGYDKSTNSKRLSKFFIASKFKKLILWFY